ncbi:histidine kinase [Kocuria carniphila]|uniref:sensor histidine kinase n=1 Tax=Kocuria carniphila TaxID=262208 RepID=UPI0021A92F9E|nr:histidine kinase [Kocuria carniphila]MCT1803307.1 histidine kinase [Kocuria carniphila]
MVIAAPAGSTSVREGFNRTSPLPVWLRVTLVLFAAIALFDDLRALESVDQAPATMVVIAVQMILGYVSLALIAWRPGIASALLLVPLALALFTHNYGFTLICAVIVTIATVSMLPRVMTIIYSVILAAWTITAVVVESTTDVLWIMGTPLVTGVLIGVALRFFVIQHRENKARLRSIEAAHQQLREQERLELARDLHDVVAHELTLVTMQAAGSHRQNDPVVLHDTICTMENAARSGLQELRTLLHILRESPGAVSRNDNSSGLTTGSLESLVDSLSASLTAAGFSVTVNTVDGFEKLPTSVRGTAARILQEASTNIIKYAPAGSTCLLSLTTDANSVMIRTENELQQSYRSDDGEFPMTSGYGLHGIQERVALLNGEVTYGPQDDRWVLDVRIPFGDA